MPRFPDVSDVNIADMSPASQKADADYTDKVMKDWQRQLTNFRKAVDRIPSTPTEATSSTGDLAEVESPELEEKSVTRSSSFRDLRDGWDKLSQATPKPGMKRKSRLVNSSGSSSASSPDLTMTPVVRRKPKKLCGPGDRAPKKSLTAEIKLEDTEEKMIVPPPLVDPKEEIVVPPPPENLGSTVNLEDSSDCDIIDP